ncbi:beta-L-arabinofuranosidase domain-containing protein [Paenibacillus sp. CAU 1782]
MTKKLKRFVPLSDVSLTTGIFKDSQVTGEQYLLSLDIDRFLAPCWEAHGLKGKKARYEGWEARSISGHSLGHYLSALSAAYAASGNETLKKALQYAVGELAEIQRETESGYIGGLKEEAFTKAFAGEAGIGGFNMGDYWVPWYSVHKIYKGLIDAYRLTDNREALETVDRFAAWAVAGLDSMSDDSLQGMLQCEHGGMNEVFAQLYTMTGKAEYLKAAVRFTHKLILDPLEQERDALQGLHANTQIPKVTGAAEIYNADPARSGYRTAARYFWDTIVDRRSYAFGGSSISEHFEAPGMESLGIKTAEACFTYNMLDLTQKLFLWEQDSRYMDYFENALYNHILGTQDPCTGHKTYFTSTLQGHYRIYGTHDTAWWCCTGTGMENPAKYGEGIYMEDDSSLYVNLYMPSQVEWKSQGLTLKQETNFPYSSLSTLTVVSGGSKAALKLRVPSWLAGEMTVEVSDGSRYAASEPGYLTIEREWKAGDRLDVTLPMKLHKYTARDNASTIAFFYGPILLAGRFGNEGLPQDTIIDETALNPATADVPILRTENEDIDSWISVKDEATLAFEISREVASHGKPVELVPFYAIHHEFYNVYWKLNDEGDPFLKLLNDMTIDSVEPDGQQDEIGHGLQGNCLESSFSGSFADSSNRMVMWREAFGVDDAYFSYRMSVNKTGNSYLCVAYWGGDHSGFWHDHKHYNRRFGITVDDVEIAEQTIHFNKSGGVFYVAYDIPNELTEGKEKVAIAFHAKGERGCAGRVAGIRVTSALPEL